MEQRLEEAWSRAGRGGRGAPRRSDHSAGGRAFRPRVQPGGYKPVPRGSPNAESHPRGTAQASAASRGPRGSQSKGPFLEGDEGRGKNARLCPSPGGLARTVTTPANGQCHLHELTPFPQELALPVTMATVHSGPGTGRGKREQDSDPSRDSAGPVSTGGCRGAKLRVFNPVRPTTAAGNCETQFPSVTREETGKRRGTQVGSRSPAIRAKALGVLVTARV